MKAAFWLVVAGLLLGKSGVMAQRIVQPGGTKRTIPQPYLQALLTEMKTPSAQAGATNGMYRVAGVVSAVGDGGVLLANAAAVRWVESREAKAGAIVTKLEPGEALKLPDGHAFVDGIKANPGQVLKMNLYRDGAKAVTVNGRTHSVPQFVKSFGRTRR